MSGISRLPALMDAIAERHDEDVHEVLDRMDVAREKLEKSRGARRAHMQSRSRKISPPPATEWQSRIQKAADLTCNVATATTAVTLAISILTGSFTLATGSILAHSAFDSLGGYEWLKNYAVDQFGVEEQASRTATAAIRALAYGASLSFGVIRIAETISGVKETFQRAFVTTAGSMAEKIDAGLQLVVPQEGGILSGGMRIGSALGGAAGFIQQDQTLKSYHATAKGQWEQARMLEIHQDEKDNIEAVSGLAKQIKALRANEASAERDYKGVVNALDISVAAGG